MMSICCAFSMTVQSASTSIWLIALSRPKLKRRPITAAAANTRFSCASNRSSQRPMSARTLSGTSPSATVRSVRNAPAASQRCPPLEQMPVHLLDEEGIALACLKDHVHQMVRHLPLAEVSEHQHDGVLGQATQLEGVDTQPQQLFQRSAQRRVVRRISAPVGPHDD